MIPMVEFFNRIDLEFNQMCLNSNSTNQQNASTRSLTTVDEIAVINVINETVTDVPNASDIPQNM